MGIRKYLLLFTTFLISLSCGAANVYRILWISSGPIYIDGRLAKVGTLVKGNSTISWGKSGQEMMVVEQTPTNPPKNITTYRFSSAEYKKAAKKKFSDFLLYKKSTTRREVFTFPENLFRIFEEGYILNDELEIDLEPSASASGNYIIKISNAEGSLISPTEPIVLTPEEGVIKITRDDILKLNPIAETEVNLFRVKLKLLESDDEYQLTDKFLVILE